MTEEDKNPQAASGQQAGRQVLLQKMYVKDASVEVPDGPAIFQTQFRPKLDVDLNTHVSDLGDDSHQVTLTVTLTAYKEEQTAYIVEVQHAGVFKVTGFEGEQHSQVLGAYCPSLVFPFTREVVGDLVQRAGFPHFLLQPVNFDALYLQHRQKEQQGGGQAQH